MPLASERKKNWTWTVTFEAAEGKRLAETIAGVTAGSNPGTVAARVVKIARGQRANKRKQYRTVVVVLERD
jgi:hypothetical protein